jgi:hypothetical protein
MSERQWFKWEEHQSHSVSSTFHSYGKFYREGNRYNSRFMSLHVS